MAKTISAERDQWQSSWLAWMVGGGLLVGVLALLWHEAARGIDHRGLLSACLVSLTFGMAVWGLRAATPMAAGMGAVICLLVTRATQSSDASLVRSGLLPLMALFLLTFVAGRLGRRNKRVVAEEDRREQRQGRDSAQVVANLGAGGLAMAVAGVFGPGEPVFAVFLLAALVEATADTVSSEIGSAFGGTPRLITNFQRVPAGTDGAISVKGTLAGLAAGAAVTVIGIGAMRLGPQAGLAAWLGGAAGLVADSLLGATIERRGCLGNNLVNFVSTIVGGCAGVAFGLWIH